MGLLRARCPSCYPAVGVKALKETVSIDPNQWRGLILSSSTTRLHAGSSTPVAVGTLGKYQRIFAVWEMVPLNAASYLCLTKRPTDRDMALIICVTDIHVLMSLMTVVVVVLSS